MGAAIEVHRTVGPGVLESVYQEFMGIELKLRGLDFEPQKKVPLVYKGCRAASDLRLDLLVERLIIVEMKSVDRILPVHEAQLLTYPRLTDLVGLLINFNVPKLTYGIKRIVNNFKEPTAAGQNGE